MRKLALPGINFVPGYYVHCDLKRYGKLSSAASLPRDIKDSGWQVCAFLYDENILGRGEVMRNLQYIHTRGTTRQQDALFFLFFFFFLVLTSACCVKAIFKP